MFLSKIKCQSTISSKIRSITLTKRCSRSFMILFMCCRMVVIPVSMGSIGTFKKSWVMILRFFFARRILSVLRELKTGFELHENVEDCVVCLFQFLICFQTAVQQSFRHRELSLCRCWERIDRCCPSCPQVMCAPSSLGEECELWSFRPSSYPTDSPHHYHIRRANWEYCQCKALSFYSFTVLRFHCIKRATNFWGNDVLFAC